MTASIEVRLLATSDAHLRGDNEYEDTGLMDATFIPDSRLAVSDDEGTVRLYSTSAQRLDEVAVATIGLPGERWACETLAWNYADQHLAVLANRWIAEGRIQAWIVFLDGHTLTPLQRWPLNDGQGDGYLNHMSWASRGSVLALREHGLQLVIRRQADGTEMSRLAFSRDLRARDFPDRLALTMDGAYLATAAAQVQIWPIVDGVPRDPFPIATSEDAWDLIWSPDRRKLAWSDHQGGVWFWEWIGSHPDSDHGRVVALDHPEETYEYNLESREHLAMEKLAWSPDGEWLAGLDVLGSLYFWHVASGVKYTYVQAYTWAGLMWGLVWGPQGLLASPGPAGSVRLWQISML